VHEPADRFAPDTGAEALFGAPVAAAPAKPAAAGATAPGK
jgi:hypothetical protein